MANAYIQTQDIESELAELVQSDETTTSRPHGIFPKRLVLISATCGALALVCVAVLHLSGSGGGAPIGDAVISEQALPAAMPAGLTVAQQQAYQAQAAAQLPVVTEPPMFVAQTPVGTVPPVSAVKAETPQTPAGAEEASQGTRFSGGSAMTATVGDGNKCLDEEEEHEGMCYTKCSKLVALLRPSVLPENAAQAVRKNAYTCCYPPTDCNDPLSFTGWDVGSIIPCDDFDTSSTDGTGRSCPHVPGGCKAGDQQFFGQCVKSCSVLTGGMFPHRISFQECCRYNDPLQCMNPDDFVISTDMSADLGTPDTKLTR